MFSILLADATTELITPPFRDRVVLLCVLPHLFLISPFWRHRQQLGGLCVWVTRLQRMVNLLPALPPLLWPPPILSFRYKRWFIDLGRASTYTSASKAALHHTTPIKIFNNIFFYTDELPSPPLAVCLYLSFLLAPLSIISLFVSPLSFLFVSLSNPHLSW